MRRRDYLFRIGQTATDLVLMVLLITGISVIAEDRENQQNSQTRGN